MAAGGALFVFWMIVEEHATCSKKSGWETEHSRAEAAEAKLAQAEEALEEIGDLVTGWTRPMSDNDRKMLIERVVVAALRSLRGISA